MSDIVIFSTTGFENIKAKDDYVLSYNRRLRLANWVAEVITPLFTTLPLVREFQRF